MIGATTKFLGNAKKVQKAARNAGFRNFRHGAARIRRIVLASIVEAEGPSRPGDPPHTHRGQYLRFSILFWGDEKEAVIGPRYSKMKDAGAAHEFGETFRGANYPRRPFMRPALEESLAQFAGDWAGSIGE